MSAHFQNRPVWSWPRNASEAGLTKPLLLPITHSCSRDLSGERSLSEHERSLSGTVRRAKGPPKRDPPRPSAERFRRVRQAIGRNLSLRSSWKRDALEAYWPTIYWRATTVTTKNVQYLTDTTIALHSKNRSNALILLRSFPASRADRGME